MGQLELFVGGMSCRRCVREVTARLRDVPGVETVSANPATVRGPAVTGSMRADVLAAFAGTTYRPGSTAPERATRTTSRAAEATAVGQQSASRARDLGATADHGWSVTTKGHVMSSTSSTAEARSSRRWLALGVIAAAQFMVIMDTSIIGVALPKMQHDLGFTPQGLSWVFNAYVVAFGGLLLLGGRLSDLFGARRIFSIGWVDPRRRLPDGRARRQRGRRARRPRRPGRRRPRSSHRPR